MVFSDPLQRGAHVGIVRLRHSRAAERGHVEAPGAVPEVIEALRDVPHDRAGGVEVEIAIVRLLVGREIAVADIPPADDRDAVVRDEGLVVHTVGDPLEIEQRVEQLGLAAGEGIEQPHLDVRMRAQPLELVVRPFQVHVVEQQADADAAFRSVDHRGEHFTSRAIRPPDVVLQIEGLLRERDESRQVQIGIPPGRDQRKARLTPMARAVLGSFLAQRRRLLCGQRDRCLAVAGLGRLGLRATDQRAEHGREAVGGTGMRESRLSSHPPPVPSPRWIGPVGVAEVDGDDNLRAQRQEAARIHFGPDRHADDEGRMFHRVRRRRPFDEVQSGSSYEKGVGPEHRFELGHGRRVGRDNIPLELVEHPVHLRRSQLHRVYPDGLEPCVTASDIERQRA